MKILYPLWLKVALIVVFARQILSMNGGKERTPQQMLKALRDLYLSLPMPEGKAMNALTAQIIEWIDQERARIIILNSVGVERVNLVRNDL